jgi:hypothetical protein
MRIFSVSILCVFLSSICFAADDAAYAQKIRDLLVTKKYWTMYLEYTDSPTPSDRANRFSWEYFERDGKLMGRRVGMAFGSCEIELSVRSDGFSFRWCDPQLGGAEPMLSYDASDPKFPFKNREPRKFWLKAND